VEAALACAAAAARVTLSYRGEAFNRVKRKNRERLDTAVAAQQLTLQTRSEVVEILPGHVQLTNDGAAQTIPNDFVIVCAGGVLPIDLLRSVGIRFETKFGAA
jgi:thioredoxin reductase